jgi:hypothetical protein
MRTQSIAIAFPAPALSGIETLERQIVARLPKHRINGSSAEL